MRPTAPACHPLQHRWHNTGSPMRPRRPMRRDEAGSVSSLELMALTPMLALLVLFILWAGRASRAELITSLAAEEAAVAAAVCCNANTVEEPADDPDAPPRSRQVSDREIMAEAVIAARPGLDYLCLGGPRPAADSSGYVTTAQADLTAANSGTSLAERVLVVTTHVTCETDGATAPVRGLFGTRTLHGHGAHIAVRPRMVPSHDEQEPENVDDSTPDSTDETAS